MNIWLYWENIKGKKKPEYLDICLETIKKNKGEFNEVVVLNENTIHNYIELPTYWKDVGCIAHKTDYLRSRLIMKYGGLWLDSDTIVISNLDWILNELKKYDFVGWGDENGPYIGTFACNKGGELVKRWVERQDKIFYKKQWGWAKLGTDILWEESKRYKNKLFRYKMVAPIDWRDWRLFLDKSVNLDKVMKRETKMITLYNNFMKDSLLKEMDVKGVMESDMLISKIFRKVLSVEDIIKKYNDCIENI